MNLEPVDDGSSAAPKFVTTKDGKHDERKGDVGTGRVLLSKNKAV